MVINLKIGATMKSYVIDKGLDTDEVDINQLDNEFSLYLSGGVLNAPVLNN